MCMNEACSVCTCAETEVPSVWIYGKPAQPTKAANNDGFGWISTASSSYGYDGHDESLGRVSLTEQEASNRRQEEQAAKDPENRVKASEDYIQYLHATEDCSNGESNSIIKTESPHSTAYAAALQGGNAPMSDYCDDYGQESDDIDDEWTSLHPLPTIYSEVPSANPKKASTRVGNVHGVYVNLLENPERFTGYSGFPAHRVWRAIKEENCFGTSTEEQCYEKRIFFR
jgi:hypothetical protein